MESFRKINGWLVVDLPLWKIFVSWDYDSGNMEKKTIQTTNQVGNIKSMGILSQATHFQMSHPALASQAPHWWHVFEWVPWDTSQRFWPRTSNSSLRGPKVRFKRQESDRVWRNRVKICERVPKLGLLQGPDSGRVPGLQVGQSGPWLATWVRLPNLNWDYSPS